MATVALRWVLPMTAIYLSRHFPDTVRPDPPPGHSSTIATSPIESEARLADVRPATGSKRRVVARKGSFKAH